MDCSLKLFKVLKKGKYFERLNACIRNYVAYKLRPAAAIVRINAAAIRTLRVSSCPSTVCLPETSSSLLAKFHLNHLHQIRLQSSPPLAVRIGDTFAADGSHSRSCSEWWTGEYFPIVQHGAESVLDFQLVCYNIIFGIDFRYHWNFTVQNAVDSPLEFRLDSRRSTASGHTSSKVDSRLTAELSNCFLVDVWVAS